MPTYKNTGLEYIPNLTDINNNKVNLAPSLEIQSYKIYNIPNLTKISDEPYYSLTKVYEPNFTSPGIINNLLDCKIIRLTPIGDITITFNSSENPNIFNLIDNVPIDIENSKEIESIIFTGSGTIKIEGF